MKIYVDCGSGVAGDMFISALAGLGMPPREFDKTLTRALKLKDCKLQFVPAERNGWPAWSFRVVGDRWFGSLEQMIRRIALSSLPAAVKQRSRRILQDLQEAEKQAHQELSSAVDELGMVDTLIDVAGSSWGFWKLGIQSADASMLNTGRIAPATAALLKKYQVPVYSDNARYELATPTGVAILANLADNFTGIAPMRLGQAGYGAGATDLPGRPNILALYQGQRVAGAGTYPIDSVLLLETVIDDMDPRLYPHVTELLFKAGALDVWWTAIGMKKGRPGISYSVLCPTAKEGLMLDILFQETTTLGIRRLPLQRWILPRQVSGMTKIARLPGGQTKSRTEYEQARAAAVRDALPLRKVLK